MIKCLLVAGIALATAVFAFDGTVCLVPVDKTGAAPTSAAYVPTPSYGRDVIYDDQTYDYGYCATGLSIYGAANYELADDFIPEDPGDVTVQEVVIWISAQGVDLRCDFFEGSSSGPGDAPPADFFNEEVPSGDITWEATGDYLYGYPIIKCTVPISDCGLIGGDYYWLGFQTTSGPNTFWWVFDYGTYGGPYWQENYFYYISYWTPGQYVFGSKYDNFYELWGSTGPPDEEDPTVTDMYPLDDDFPSGVPPADNTAGCHWRDGDPDTNKGIDVENSVFTVYDPDDEVVAGMLDIDDSDLWDVIVDFEADDPWEEGAIYMVETETYDLAGNSANETWYFTTGYTNVAPASLGVIKAGFAE
jgi:hypothetical protein